MNKKVLKTIFLILFLGSIFVISYIELIGNLKIIRNEYIRIRDYKNNTNITILDEPVNDYEYNKDDELLYEPITVEEPKANKLGNWRAIERLEGFNNELQFYSTNNVVIGENKIDIISRKEVMGDKNYSSGQVESNYLYKYGTYKFIIEIPEGGGLFPAIWLLPESGNPLPEIDIFEMIGSEPYEFYGVIHYEEEGIYKRDYFKHNVPKKNQYSISLDWHANSLSWSIDNEEIYSTTQGVPMEYMYIIINQAVGGNWPGNPNEDTLFPSYFKVIDANIDPIFKKSRD